MKPVLALVLLVAFAQANEISPDPIRSLMLAAKSQTGESSLLSINPREKRELNAQDPKKCDLLKLMDDGTDLVVSTVKTINQIFKIIYQRIAHKTDCPFDNGFRCFLKEYSDFMAVFKTIVNQIRNAANNSPGFFMDVSDCLGKSTAISF